MKKRISIYFIILVMLVQSMSVSSVAQAKVFLKKSVTVYIGESVKLKVNGTKKKVKWSSNKPYNVKVTSKGNVTPLCYGRAVITAKVGKKKYKCRVKAKWPYLNAKMKKLEEGATFTLRVVGTHIRKVTYIQKNRISVRKTSTKTVKVTALSEGPATVIIDAGRSKLFCTVEVVHKKVDCKGNHAWGAGEVLTASTCYSNGQMRYTCTKCGETMLKSILELAAHIPTGVWVTTKEPTELMSGTRVQYCSICGAVAKTESITYDSVNHETDWSYNEDGNTRTKTMFDGTKVEETKFLDESGNEMWGYFDDTAAKDIFTEINKMKKQLNSVYIWSDERVDAAKQEAVSYAKNGSSVSSVHMNSGGIPNVSDNRRYITFDYQSNEEIAVACFVRDSAGSKSISYGEAWQSYFGTYYASY